MENTETILEETNITTLPLWNPNAAVNWSLLFTPIFGSILIMKNWRTLGNESEAKKGLYWTIACTALITINLFASFVPDVAFIALLIVWYLVYAKKQARYIKEEFNGNYQRKSWMKPLLTGTGTLLVYLVMVLMIYTEMDAVDLEGTWRIDVDTVAEMQVEKMQTKPTPDEVKQMKRILKQQFKDWKLSFSEDAVSLRTSSLIPAARSPFKVIETGEDYLIISCNNKKMKFVDYGWNQIEMIEDGKDTGLVWTLVD